MGRYGVSLTLVFISCRVASSSRFGCYVEIVYDTALCVTMWMGGWVMTTDRFPEYKL